MTEGLGATREINREGGLVEAPPSRGDAPAIPLTGDSSLDRHTRVALLKEERAIAKRFEGGRMWLYPAFAFTCYAIWLSFFPLAIMGWLNLPLAFVLSTVFAVGGYVTSHEAMHSNIGRPGSKTRWLNEWTGKVSTIIIVFPFSMARLMHLEHHYHTNHPEKDPDYPDRANGPWHAIYKTWLNRQPGIDGSIHIYKRILKEMGTKEAEDSLKDTIRLQLIFMAVLFGMAWNGYAIEAALIWWLPRHIGLSYIRFYLSWAPHHPRVEQGRYTNTRFFKSRLGHIGSIGMETHYVHHLYPAIPSHRTREAYYALRPILRQRGVDCPEI